MNINSDVMAALYNHMQLLRDEFPIVFQLNKYETQSNNYAPYIRINLSRNVPNRLTMDNGGQYQYRGILQAMIVHAPSAAEWFLPEPDYIALAQKIVTHFTSDTVLTSGNVRVRIYSMPEIGPIMSEATQLQLPVSIYWQTVK